jgi:nitrogen fixation/metabolism regulation signal transduction histidine kinase
MSIVSKIIAAHHGKVTIENCRELGGAAIHVRLPQRGVDEAEV